MKKILGIAAVLLLCGATASARTTTGPPDSANCIKMCFANVAIGVEMGSDHSASVAGDIELWMNNLAIFMNDGLLKGTRTYALDFCGQKTNLSAATEVVNPANAGKTDAAISMGDASRRDIQVAVIQSPPNPTESCGLFVSI